MGLRNAYDDIFEKQLNALSDDDHFHSENSFEKQYNQLKRYHSSDSINYMSNDVDYDNYAHNNVDYANYAHYDVYSADNPDSDIDDNYSYN
ncbi:hypothetical protein POVCU2_0092400 [Plasmodium ovale curtisi]|uniref:Uncharacterized protein n=1 Tax=Plasmodium ovale curtisi TaxID=864141 RepID=A0A1A8WUK4_PLAOA|nr:hypothetical protein POVCU2_0092400 [Plasmodium ovale curtisi]